MKHHFLPAFILAGVLCFCTAIHAQVMTGVVLDSAGKNEIQGVTIINKKRNAVAFSDSNGHYSIIALPGDSLLFTHTAYRPVHEVAAFSFGSKYKVILMGAMVYDLGVAIVTGMTKYQKDSLANREMFTHAMNEPLTHINPIMSPVSFVADKILGISKRAKRFKNEFYTDEQNAFIDTRYTPDLVSSQTGLKGDSLAYFMNTYPMEYQYARQASDLEMKMWVRNNYKQYLDKINSAMATSKQK